MGTTDDRNDPALRKIGPDGMWEKYLVLSEEEQAQGYVRPVRRTYIHQTCGAATTMGDAIARTYARDPYFYGATFCATCRRHFPVGPEGEFTWEDGSKVGT